jgi:trimeric autotransporter adhesin
MQNRNTIFTTVVLVVTCFAVSPVVQARQQSEDRGNGNSAAENVQALNLGTTGSNNTAHGWFSLFSNTEGSDNTANGFDALFSNTTGGSNTAIGDSALFSNTTGAGNTASGARALFSNTEGFFNTANGFAALFSNTTGSSNTAIGDSALASNTTAVANTAVGFDALVSNTTGVANTAVGFDALDSNTTGNHNIALGTVAGGSVTSADNVICIGLPGENVSNSCYIAQIFGQTSAGGTAVFINSDGKLGTTTSSRRFKEGIKPMNKASEVLFRLNPVIFHYKKEIDPKAIPQLGLVAEEVEQLNPDLVVRDKEGKPYSVRYEAINTMLLNEFLKEHKRVEKQAREIQEQKATINELKRGMETVVAHLKEQDSKIQKVGAQIEVRNPVPQMVLNKQ